MAALAAALSLAREPLLSQGWAVSDDAVPDDVAAELHAAMCELQRCGALRQHRFGFKASASAPPQIFTKPHIFEAELDDAAVGRAAPRLAALFERLSLPSAARVAFPELQLLAAPSSSETPGPSSDGVTVKLQCNVGSGGCFPVHYDNAGPPSRRRLTCLLYLNPEWKEGDGGEIQLLPWLSAPVTVAPVHARLVLFLSDTVAHCVLPSHAERRLCCTVWLDGLHTNGAGSLSLRFDPSAHDADALCRELTSQPAQRVLSRAVYDEEYAASRRVCSERDGLTLILTLTLSLTRYAASLRACLERDAPQQLGPMLAAHTQHVRASGANQAMATLVKHARALKHKAGAEIRIGARARAESAEVTDSVNSVNSVTAESAEAGRAPEPASSAPEPAPMACAAVAAATSSTGRAPRRSAGVDWQVAAVVRTFNANTLSTGIRLQTASPH